MDYHPVRALVDAALDGAPFLITLGEANASKSALLPVCLIGISILVSFFFCGFVVFKVQTCFKAHRTAGAGASDGERRRGHGKLWPGQELGALL